MGSARLGGHQNEIGSDVRDNATSQSVGIGGCDTDTNSTRRFSACACILLGRSDGRLEWKPGACPRPTRLHLRTVRQRGSLPLQQPPDRSMDPPADLHLQARFPGVRLVADEEGRALRLVNRLKKAVALVSPRAARHAFRFAIPALTPNYRKAARSPPRNSLRVIYVDGIAESSNGVDGDNGVASKPMTLGTLGGQNRRTSPLVSLRNLLRFATRFGSVCP